MPSPTPSSSPSSAPSAAGHTFFCLVAFVMSSLCSLLLFGFMFLPRQSLSDSAALRLPDEFSIAATMTTGSYSRPSFWVFDPARKEGSGEFRRIRAKVVAPQEKLTKCGLNLWILGCYFEYELPLPHPPHVTQMQYYAGEDDLLISGKVSSKGSWHILEFANWEKKPLVGVLLHDGGEGEIMVTGPTGALVAVGHQDFHTGTLTFSSVEGLPLATVARQQESDEWKVTIDNPWRVPTPIYALLAVYQKMTFGTASGVGR